MAYLEKYKGYWTNPTTGYDYDITLFQDTAVSGSKDIKVQDVTFRYTLNDRILTSSVDVTFVNDLGWNEFDDLLNNTEREWYVRIRKYNDSDYTVFLGYIAVDIMERDFSNDIGTISFTATDDLKKLREIYVDDVSLGYNHDLQKVLVDGLNQIDQRNISINNALFYKDHDMGTSDTMLAQTYLNADYFYKNNVETISYWDYIQSLCTATNSYLYIYNDRYYLERYNDVSTNENWVYYSPVTDTNGVAIRKFVRYNKQDDFDYVNRSQKLEYVSGLSDFTVNIDPKEFVSILPNSWDVPLEEISSDENPNDEALELRTYYLNTYHTPTLDTNQSTGTNNYSMRNYLVYDCSYVNVAASALFNYMGEYPATYLMYSVPITFNDGDSTPLNIKYKLSTQNGYSYDDLTEWQGIFLVRKSWLVTGDKWIYDNNGTIDLASGSADAYWVVDGNKADGSNIVEINATIELNSIKADCSTNERLTFFIMPIAQINHEEEGDEGTLVWPQTAIMGDFEIKVGVDGINNQFIYDVNDGFINKAEVDLDIYDMRNENVKNGLFLSDWTKTDDSSGWTDDGGSTYDSIINHYVKSETGRSYKTREALNATIKFKAETFLKPLAFLNDEKIPGKDFMVLDYTWNMLNGRYALRADEYSSDKGEINITE